MPALNDDICLVCTTGTKLWSKDNTRHIHWVLLSLSMALPGCCASMEQLQRLQRTVDRTRDSMVRPVNMNLSMDFRAGPGGYTVKKNLVDMAEEMRRSDEFQMVMKGGVLSVPGIELRTMKLPMPDRRDQIKFKEGNKNTIDSKGMWKTIEDITEDLKKIYLDMVARGVTDAEARVKGTDEYIKLHSYLDQAAKVTAKETIKGVLEALGMPGMIVRGMKLEKKTIETLQKFGLLTRLPKNDKGLDITDWEADIVAAYVWGATLHVVVGEVKRKSKSPWENSKTLEHGVVSKALNQLRTDLEFLQAFLEDFPATSIKLHYVAVFPETKVAELQQHFCTACLTHVLGQEDLADPDMLRKKLNIPDTTNPPQVEATAEEMLLALLTRFFGLTRVYVGHRLIKDRPRVEEARTRHHREMVDKNIHVLLPMDQWTQLTQATRSHRSIIFTGGPGSGKTELLKAACKESNPEVLVISAYRQEATDPILEHLQQAGQGQAPTVLALPWRALLEEVGLREEDYRTGRKFADGQEITDLPRLFLALCWKVAALHPNLRVSVGIDEVIGVCAPITDGKHDWTQLTSALLPPSITLLLTINPQHQHPILLTSPSDTFLVINSRLCYRSTDNLTTFAQRLAELVPEGQKRRVMKGTDVKGPLPTIVDMGKVEEAARVAEEVKGAIARLRGEGRETGTVLHDLFLSPAVRREVEAVAGAEGWQVSGVEDFVGWEADTVIYAGPGDLEAASRARVRLVVLLAWDPAGLEEGKEYYGDYSPAMQQLVGKGLAERRAPTAAAAQ